jgi:outer membrane cobalamin receptor
MRGWKAKLEAGLFARINASVEYTYLHAQDLSQNPSTELIYRPRHVVAGLLDYRSGAWIVGISGRYSSASFADQQNTHMLPSYKSFDANLGYRVFASSSHAGREAWIVYNGLNLTDAQSAIIQGYPLPGREHRVSLSLKF